MHRHTRPIVAALLVAALLTTALTFFAAHRALAYGQENWQIGFSATGVVPSTGQDFGFWGWCAFGGGVTSGNNGDCEVSQYFHAPAGGGFTCQESVDIASWDASGGTFVISGTATVHPSSLTAPCVAIFPGSVNFTGVNSMIPAVPGHFNLGGIGGAVGEFQIQVTQIP
jgi:hypothetical protein